MVIYLASASPRRRELLAQIGVACRVCPVGVDERPLPGEAPDRYATRLAVDKAVAGARALPLAPAGAPAPLVLGADTVVVIDGRMLGKPAGREDAAAMLARLSARTHEVITAVAGVCGDRQDQRISRTAVTFRRVSAEEGRAYVATGEPDDKAGGYAIQGRAAVFVSRIEGSYTGVVGLPLCETDDLIRTLAAEQDPAAVRAAR